MKIIGINGAPSGVESVSLLLNEALLGAEVEIDGDFSIARVNLAQITMRFHDGALTGDPGSDLSQVFAEMREADGFIFATPVNWYNMSSLMKAFIDWMTLLEDKFELEGKVAGVITHCNCDGGMQAAMSIIGPLLHMGLMVPPYCAFYRNRCVGKQSEGQWQMTDQVLVGRNVVRLIKATRNHEKHWHL